MRATLFGLVSLMATVHLVNGGAVSPPTVYMCNSMIYCQGPIIEAVNRLAIYNDSKEYVDTPLKYTEEETLKAFSLRFPDVSKIEPGQLKQFLENYFGKAGEEMKQCIPSDWKAEPDTFTMIKDPMYRQWAIELQAIWLKLCRHIDHNVMDNFDKNSLIYVPNNFIVAGGRFREYYYWDSYWIIKGLLVSGMYETIKGILRNFAYLIAHYGFIPNGGRVYYLERSQPPFFIPMVYEYYTETKDLQLVRELLPQMAAELKFWLNNRTVNVIMNGKIYTVYQYRSNSNTPRPESYKEDVRSGIKLNDAQKVPILYQNLATSAESGQDFSSRWFANLQNLTTSRITEILPVDLNAIMCWNYQIMAELNQAVGNTTESNLYYQHAEQIREMVESLFYNKSIGSWFDVALLSNKHIQQFFASNAVPLFTRCYNVQDTTRPKVFHDYMQKSGALSFPSGIPSSLRDTGEQWDLPNGWPPQNHMIIEGLRKSGNPELEGYAYKLADQWLHANYIVYSRNGHSMYEKLDVTDAIHRPGGGGEYEVQIGFGWTNGAVLDLLRVYGANITATIDSYPPSHSGQKKK